MKTAIDEQRIKDIARHMREHLGGSIFAFPIEEDNPFSQYAIVLYAGGIYHVYPTASDVSLAAVGVTTILESMQKEGLASNYEEAVRFISYQAQMDAPDVTMRRLKKGNVSGPLLHRCEDFMDGEDEDNPLFTARGVLKMSYLSMVDDRLPKAAQFMDKYYKLLSMRKYGKTAAAIKREAQRMGKDQAIKWLEDTYRRFIQDDLEIIRIFEQIKK